MGVVAADHRRRARHRGIAGGQTGAVTAIQRVGSFANANGHVHTLVPEGVWHERPDGSLGFHPLPPMTAHPHLLLGVELAPALATVLVLRVPVSAALVALALVRGRGGLTVMTREHLDAAEPDAADDPEETLRRGCPCPVSRRTRCPARGRGGSQVPGIAWGIGWRATC